MLLISHRFSSVREADWIYVLEAGRVTEHGTQEQLMAAGRTYAELFTLQAAAYTDGGSAAGSEVDGSDAESSAAVSPLSSGRSGSSA